MKRLLLLTVLVWSTLGIRAQIVEPVIGINNSWVNENVPFATHRSGTRAVVGLGTRVDVGLKWSFQPKLLFSVKGGVIEFENIQRFSDYNSYLAIPLEMTFRPHKLGFFGGIVSSYWLVGKTRIKDMGIGTGDQLSRLTFETEGNSPFGKHNRVELALRLGVHLPVKVGPGQMHIRLSYNRAVTPIYQPSSPPSNYHYRYNQWGQLTFSYPIEVKV